MVRDCGTVPLHDSVSNVYCRLRAAPNTQIAYEFSTVGRSGTHNTATGTAERHRSTLTARSSTSWALPSSTYSSVAIVSASAGESRRMPCIRNSCGSLRRIIQQTNERSLCQRVIVLLQLPQLNQTSTRPIGDGGVGACSPVVREDGQLVNIIECVALHSSTVQRRGAQLRAFQEAEGCKNSVRRVSRVAAVVEPWAVLR